MPADPRHPEAIATAVFGGQGYVAGEVLRMLALHPRMRVEHVFSTSQAGEAVTATFPHLAGTALDGLRFEDQDRCGDALTPGRPLAVFLATPHGATAKLADALLTQAEAKGAPIRVVDLSADFRFADAAQYAVVYGRAHDAPLRLREFTCAVPEHHPTALRTRHAVQPGCFTTCVTLAAFPFFALDLVEPDVFVSAITGSSGSGRTPTPATHHPERSGNLYAYNPLVHRHEAEMRLLLATARSGIAPDVAFVPHSGPFVRGIHATLRMTLRQPASAEALVQAVNDHYGARSFVRATAMPPKLTEVTGTNRCRLGIAVRDRTLVVTSVIDNLVKGAAGGAVQWMNRLFDFDDDCGLRIPGAGWS